MSMREWNSLRLEGRLTRDPMVKEKCVMFGIAVYRTKEQSDFFDCICFAENMTVMKTLSKGQPIRVEGSIQNNEWTDKEGNKRKGMRVYVNTIEVLERKCKERQPTAEEWPGGESAPF